MTDKFDLNPKQRAYCDLYLELGNQTQAYKRAYKIENDGTARTQASILMKKPNIKAYIEYRMEQFSKEKIASAEELLTFWTDVMRGKVKDQFGLDTSLNDRLNASRLLSTRVFATGDNKNDKLDKFLNALKEGL